MNTVTVGRRKTAVARAIVNPGSGTIIVNKKPFEIYFPVASDRTEVMAPFESTNTVGHYDVSINVFGGGISGQADACKLAIARSLDKINEEFRPMLRVKGLLTRDSRMVERKKPGLKKARKRFQFSKR